MTVGEDSGLQWTRSRGYTGTQLAQVYRLQLPQLRIQPVSYPIAKKVECERHEEDRYPREQCYPVRSVYIRTPISNHRTPRWIWLGYADTEEAKGRLGQNQLTNVQAGYHHHRVRYAGNQMLPDNPE